MRITGTFIDEITIDIPSNNWGTEQWARDFRAMQHIGIDTVVIIRGGFEERAVFPSDSLGRHMNILVPPSDLPKLFLDLADENDMVLYFGTYDSNRFWHDGNHQKEIDINRDFADEVFARYGSHPAFRGWYITQELARKNEAGVECIRCIAQHCKSISDGLPILISPYLMGVNQFDDPITLGQHEQEWNDILSRLADSVDIVAFQDGNVDYHELPDYLAVNNNLITKHAMVNWSNVETFDRDMPFKFPPIDWSKLWIKLQAAEEAQSRKVITFEFSHFMSPNSCWPAARNLYERYCDYFNIDRFVCE